jgi:hypothetical protein
MSFGFMNDSTQDFLSPNAGTVAFLFRDTTPQELDTTMRSLGACPKAKLGHGWRFSASGQPSLDFDLIENVADYAIDLVWESWKFYVPLLEALFVSEAGVVIVNVAIPDDPSALKALRTIALTMLRNHNGVVRDSNTEHVWTPEEIASNSIRCGRRFLGKDDAVAGGADTA